VSQKEFLLKFSKDRNRYLQWLYQARKRYGLTILKDILYCWPTAPEPRRDFIHEMSRFLAVATVEQTVAREEFWPYLLDTITDQCQQARTLLLAVSVIVTV